MSIDINLVGKLSPHDTRKEKIKKLKNVSIVALLITGFFAIVIFAIDYRFSASYVRKQQADLLKELDTYSKTSAKIYILNSRLSEISSLLGQRKNYQETAGLIVGNAPQSLTVEEFSINETGVSLTVSSISLEPIDTFLNSTLELVKNKKIAGVILQNLSMGFSEYTVKLQIL